SDLGPETYRVVRLDGWQGPRPGLCSSHHPYAGQPYIRLIFSFINRQGTRMSDFVRLDGLCLQARVEGSMSPARIEQMSAEPQRSGWFRAGNAAFGLRWFWQLYPKAFETRADGTVRLELYPENA